MFERLLHKRKQIQSPFHITNRTLFRYHSFVNDATEIEVPETVVDIAPFAFENCSRLEKVLLPNGLKSIGEGAFAGCRALRDIHLPPSLVSIGKNAFSNCLNLREVVMPANIVQIGEGIFKDCGMLQRIVLPEELTQIPDHAFYSCRKLSEIRFPRRLIGIQANAFSFCAALTEVTLPDSTRYLFKYAFADCRALRRITLPERVDSVDVNSFDGCPDDMEFRLLHRHGVLVLREPRAKFHVGAAAEFLRRPSTSQLEWMFVNCSRNVLMEFAAGLFTQYPEFADFLELHGDNFAAYLIEREQCGLLQQLIDTGYLGTDHARSCLDCAITHTQEGGSAEPQMLLMRYLKPDTPTETRFRL
ncbi:MAG: leucine-rich repeat domain-containing protein [Oscillospiraceae bacterium]|nr:leucine-rich repeat domain-containing protein [Oscillospiraceae bacterium]